MISLKANKKKEVYGPVQKKSNTIADDIMQRAVQKAQKNEADFQTAKNMAENPKSPVIGQGTYTVKVGDSGYSRKGTTVPKNVMQGQTTPHPPQAVPLPLTGEGKIGNPEEVLKSGIANKAPVEELMPVWNQYWGQVQENVKNDPSLAPYMYNQTYRDWMTYTGQDSQIGEQIRNAIARGADPGEVEQLLAKRTYKATQNPYLNEYAYDEIYQTAREYIENNQDKYKDNYKDKIAERLAKRNKPFSYSVADDPLYQQYLQQAREQGRMAMEDTLSAAAIGAGGMNSYAIAAAQGINNNYMQRVNDVIPELYQLAYDKYLNEQNRQAEDINMLMALENQDYGRWATERARDDELKNLYYERTLNDENTKYQRELYADQTEYERAMAEREWNYGVQNDAFNKAVAFAETGIIDEGLIAESGIPREVFEQIKNMAIASQSKTSSGSGSSAKKTEMTGPQALSLLEEEKDTPAIRAAACSYLGVTEDELEEMYGLKKNSEVNIDALVDEIVSNSNGGFIAVRGYGRVSPDEFVSMVLSGEIEVDEDGTYRKGR